MKKFIFKLFLIASAIVLIVIGMHVWAIYSLQGEVERQYTLTPNQQYLFIGSSELGCALIEAPEYHNKVLFVVNSGLPAALMRLEELERRHQLEYVKVFVTPFYEPTIAHNKRDNNFNWYKELPVSWRYLDELSDGLPCFMGYIATSLHYPLPITVSDQEEINGQVNETTLAKLPELARKKTFRGMKELGESFDFPDSLESDWTERTELMFDRMNEICKRHGIRFVTVSHSFLPYYYSCISDKSKAFKAQWVKHLADKGIEHIVMPNIFSEDDYVDQVHLVKKSRSRYTEMMFELLGRRGARLK